MEERLYLFEVLIDNIYFDENVSEIPQKKQIVVSVNLSKIVTLEIRSETLPIGGEGGNKRLIDFKSGKSHLMPLVQKNLLHALDSHGLEISVGVRGAVVPIGTSIAPWDDCFKEMVQVSHEEFVTPAVIFDNYCLMENGVIKGNVQMFLRLSCFGKSIQTQFEVLHESGNKQILFKSPNMATTFACSKYGVGTSTDFLPIGPLYNSGYMRGNDKPTAAAKSASWTAVMEGRSSSMMEKRSSLTSVCLFPEYLSIMPPVKDSAITFDIISLKGRPEEDKFLDFLTGKKFGDLQGSIQSFALAESKDTTHKTIKDMVRNRSIHHNKINPEAKNHGGYYFNRIPLRLRGGGQSEDAYVESHRLRAGGLSISPIAECRDIMEQFDKILEQYKKAISPCGEIGCDYTPNITETLCKRTCGVEPGNANTTGCGLPECEYARYKSALMQLDYDIEKQFIGPVILGNCGHPKCSYRADPVLPPIHWDCPEPLPLGKCKNPLCPYTTPDLQNQSRFSSTKGPCGSDQCPYSPPAPCSSPNCPFINPPPCESLKKTSNAKNSTKRENVVCSGCPFDNPSQIINMMFCDNPNCEYVKTASVRDCQIKDKICEIPHCPYKMIQNQCSNPECPYSQSNTKNMSKSCSNPQCPNKENTVSTPDEASSASTACSNDDCLFRDSSKEDKEPPKETCANPDCPFNIPSVEVCQNPECPFLKGDSSTDSRESCDNPDCPYKKGSKISEDSECECDNPNCPSKRDTCLNPNCPFNLRGLNVCTNPDCPHKIDALGRDLGYCATPDPSFNEFCADKTCPYHDRKLDKSKEDEKGDKSHYGKSVLKVGSQEIEEGILERTSGHKPSVYDLAPCSLKTCKYMGGHLTCVDCGVGVDGKKRGPCPKTCPGDPLCALATVKKLTSAPRRRDPIYKRTCSIMMKRKKKKAGHTTKIEYPGYRIGHRECVMPYFYVPPRMGWLWNIHTPCMNLKPRRGWRPGAITKAVARAILKHKKAASQESRTEKKVRRRRNNDDSSHDLISPKPTLEIKKREGIYHITMNPLKDPEKLEMNENPYVDCNPMQFKVAKTNIDDPDVICTDEGEIYKYDSSSDDELDIQVTSPAGIIHPDRPTLKKVVSVKETQYNIKDIPPPDKTKGKKKKKGGKGDEGKDGKEKAANEKGEKDKNEKGKGDKDKNMRNKVEQTSKEKITKEPAKKGKK